MTRTSRRRAPLRPRLLAAAVLLVVTGCRPSASPAAPVAATATPTPRPPVTSAPTAPRTQAPAATPTATSGGTVQRVTAADLPRSWHPGCPVPPSQLRLLTVPYVGFDGRRHQGRVVVSARAAADVARVFTTLAAERFPIRSVRPIDDFGGSDDASMAADNTSGFNCRQAVGGPGWSVHAYGLAIDVDPRENPYLQGGLVRPPQGRPYVDRARSQPGMVHAGDRVTRAFAAVGWRWGGRWAASPDYQHFSANGG